MNTQDPVSEIAALGRALREDPHIQVRFAIARLAAVARDLGVPTHDRRDDAPVFIEGTEAIETATLTQCGGLLFALGKDEFRDSTALAARVAERLATLLPAQLAHEQASKT